MKYFEVRIYLILFLIILAIPKVNAQEEVEEQGIELYDYSEEQKPTDLYLNLFEISFSSQIGLETFKKNLPSTSFGFRIGYYNNFSMKDNFFWSIHYQSFRLSKRSNTFFVNDQFADYNLESKAVSNVIFVGYGLRYYFGLYSPKLEPFAEIKLGLNNVYTYTSDRVEGSEESSVDFQNFDVSFAYSAGAGIQYNVRQGQALHLIANFNSGNTATYYIDEEKAQEYPWDNFDRKTTQLDYLQVIFGISFGF